MNGAAITSPNPNASRCSTNPSSAPTAMSSPMIARTGRLTSAWPRSTATRTFNGVLVSVPRSKSSRMLGLASGIVAPPNGSRLSCGRPARWRKAGGRQSVPRQGHNTPLPLERSPPASFKRLLGRARYNASTGLEDLRPALPERADKLSFSSTLCENPMHLRDRREAFEKGQSNVPDFGHKGAHDGHDVFRHREIPGSPSCSGPVSQFYSDRRTITRDLGRNVGMRRYSFFDRVLADGNIH